MPVCTHFILLGCSGNFTEVTGNITSLNYSRNYLNNLNCEYLIDLRSSGASSVTLTFLDFQTEDEYDNVYVIYLRNHNYYIYIFSSINDTSL